MEITVNLDLSKYTRQELTRFLNEGVISHKEYYDELSERNLLEISNGNNHGIPGQEDQAE